MNLDSWTQFLKEKTSSAVFPLLQKGKIVFVSATWKVVYTKTHLATKVYWFLRGLKKWYRMPYLWTFWAFLRLVLRKRKNSDVWWFSTCVFFTQVLELAVTFLCRLNNLREYIYVVSEFTCVIFTQVNFKCFCHIPRHITCVYFSQVMKYPMSFLHRFYIFECVII